MANIASQRMNVKWSDIVFAMSTEAVVNFVCFYKLKKITETMISHQLVFVRETLFTR